MTRYLQVRSSSGSSMRHKELHICVFAAAIALHTSAYAVPNNGPKAWDQTVPHTRMYRPYRYCVVSLLSVLYGQTITNFGYYATRIAVYTCRLFLLLLPKTLRGVNQFLLCSISWMPLPFPGAKSHLPCICYRRITSLF
jgi:hypothetical protein